MGWSALQFPWVDRPLKDEELAIANSHDMPPGIEGMNMEVFQTIIERQAFASQHGYEPQTDYRKDSFFSESSLHINWSRIFWTDRRGTMIHPDFQKRGFGTFLARHCNDVVDKTGGKTWVFARPSSLKMFKQCGFKDVATHDARLERWGHNTEHGITWLLVREAQN